MKKNKKNFCAKNSDNCICIDVDASKLIRFNPIEFREVKIISKELILGNVVIVDLKDMTKEDTLRFIDTVTGILMVTKGKYKKLASKTYLLAPRPELLEKYADKTEPK